MRALALLVVLAAGVAVLAVVVVRDDGRPERRAVAATATAMPKPGPTPEPGAADAEPVNLTVAVSGDLLPHLPVVQRAQALAGPGEDYDFAPMLRELRPVLRRADLALCHVETPLRSGPPAGYPVFRTPPALARGIAATGFDACSTASNHTVDQGEAGVESTVRALDRAGVRHAGSAASARAGRRIRLLRVKDRRIAFLAYTETTNGLPVPRPWSVDLAEPGRILRDARRARRLGADAVLVNLHWGTEYRHAPDAAQRRLAKRLAGSRAITAVVGQHAHVVQPIRRVRGRWTVFGTGNLLSNQSTACCPAASQDGMVVLLTLRVGAERATVTGVRYVPTWVRPGDYTVLPVGAALRDGAADAAALRASWGRTVGVVGRGRGLRPLPARLPR